MHLHPRRIAWLTLAAVLALSPSLLGGATIATATPAAQSASPTLQVESIVGGLATVWAIDFAPDGRIFLTERGGRIRTVTNGTLDPDPWLTIEVAERSGSESG